MCDCNERSNSIQFTASVLAVLRKVTLGEEQSYLSVSELHRAYFALLTNDSNDLHPIVTAEFIATMDRIMSLEDELLDWDFGDGEVAVDPKRFDILADEVESHMDELDGMLTVHGGGLFFAWLRTRGTEPLVKNASIKAHATNPKVDAVVKKLNSRKAA